MIFILFFTNWRKYRKIVINSHDGPESSMFVCGPRFTVAIMPDQDVDPGPLPFVVFSGSKFSPKMTFYFSNKIKSIF